MCLGGIELKYISNDFPFCGLDLDLIYDINCMWLKDY